MDINTGHLADGCKSTSARKRSRREFFRKYSPLSSTSITAKPTTTRTPTEIVLDPTGKLAYYWSSIVAVAVAYYCWTVALRAAFNVEQRAWLWVLLDTTSCSIYFIDIFVQSRTCYLRDGILEQNVERLRFAYTQSTFFKVDVLSCLPLDWAYLVLFWSHPPPLIHALKLFKTYRVVQFFVRTESRSHYPNVCRFLILMHNLLIIIHWNACCYYMTSQWIGLGSDPWVYPAWNHTHNTEWGTFSKQYTYSFYWSTITLTTIGELSHPHTIFEYAFMTFEYFVGILMFASLVGNLGSIVSNVNKNRLMFQSKMDNVKTYMKMSKIPDHIQERVIKWFDYLWSCGDPMNEQHILDVLPDKLKAEIGIHVHFETLKKVDFFRKCEQGLLWEIVLRLKTQVYSPGEFVCRKGDVGREMYIVNSGKLVVLKEENGIVLKELIHGEYFGEISVLNLGFGKSHRRRTAFVQSVGYTSLLCLAQTDLLEVLNDYPKTKEMLIEKSKSKLSTELYEDIEEDEDPEPTATDILKEVPSPDDPPPMPLYTITDEIVHLKDRLGHIESLIEMVLTEITHQDSNKFRGNNRKISSQI